MPKHHRRRRRPAAHRRSPVGRRGRLRALHLCALLLSAATVTGCSSSSGPPAGGNGGASGLAVEVVADGLDPLTHLTAPPGDDRLFLVTQTGRIRIVADGRLLSTPFLDISGRVGGSGSEQGLLSMAFHPDYATNGRFYVDYTDTSGDTRVEEYRVSPDPDVADPASARRVLSVDQPFSNHNGGLVAFGPDGHLWIGLGDGGSGGDPRGNGQDTSTLLGSLLRIDVDGADPYAVPPDNPFVGRAGRDEIWSYGLRNPWRFHLDAAGGRLLVADVGQNQWEEVNAVPLDAAGVNFGWNVMEGRHCFASSDCDQTGLRLPVLEYGHDEGCSVTGGRVYRGSALSDLAGHYFYADFCQGWVRSFRPEGGGVSDRREWELGDLGRITSFGADDAGELYVLTAGGTAYRIVPDGG